MKELTEKTLLRESIEFNGSINELKEKIQITTEKKFKLEWISGNEFTIHSKISLGTFIISSYPEYFDGIKGFGKLIELKNGKTQIDLNTKLRIELYFMGIIPILAIFITFLRGKEIPSWSIFLFPFIILWFWSIYRFQEKILFRKFRNYIKAQ
ncbi:hypothetical protein [Flavobacterium sp. ov086]|uniref:hypothetical protein n=1 Tax=Flavobacterium sp. ov086 TaxID=1761785 RepID=UPI000B637928|nr:hypothetical protein [Flavobacterium sp. ov086]SNR62431.1 hypothetical protein SAMN04487979_11429 [Flavobacterium sp. ov086]